MSANRTDAEALFKKVDGGWLFSGAMQVVTLAVRQHSHPLFGDGLSYLNVFTLVMAVALAAKFIRIAINTKSLATDVAALTPRAG